MVNTPTTEQGMPVTMAAISKRFGATSAGDLLALDQIDLAVKPGEFVAIVGPSGCGKSTLLRLVAGLLMPTDGEVSVGDEPIRGPFTNTGVVFQKDLLLEWRTALANVMLQAEMRGIHGSDVVDKAKELLRTVGLEGFEGSYPSQLSGGMRQRVAICRGLLLEFPLLLMDEPFGALDALTRDQLNLDIGRLLHYRPTVLFVTHSIDEAVFLADRVVVMTPRPGRICAEIEVGLPRPRTLKLRDGREFDAYTSRVRELFLEQGVLREMTDGEVRAGTNDE